MTGEVLARRGPGPEPVGAAWGGPRLASCDRPHQPSLPLYRQWLRPADDDEFAHPAELDFSRILTYYRIPWAYEPTTFTLAWTADGRPAELFTPDFYLPDQRLYLELTTMRQRLVTRKNRKVRRLRELYPNVRIKLLYRRDYLRLVACYRAATREAACRPGRVLFTEEAIRDRIAALADRIVADHSAPVARPEPTTGEPPLLVLAVGRGSEVFAEALLAGLAGRGLACEADRIDVTRYRTLGGMRRVRVRRGPPAAIAGRRVLLVEDVVSTGLSLTYLTTWLRRRGVAVDVCTLLDRRAARLVDVGVRYAGFEAPNEVLVGFGLDLRRQFRDLPFIACLEAD